MQSYCGERFLRSYITIESLAPEAGTSE
ncbi:hypothetical protein AG1IA_09588 [Rhizoctonia solani AG-1 IA]|uniref:Uncharacterized protein n=1 Tax=Thanatephorus cucumeris (strain AG1-IA) TaxID=983506 RepID=L8WDY3_THACA|nr:hypothetical protein AG1IA_09588 [Rhizoctonia solani AG-1 IA]